jgi:hypothetical protein
MGKILELAKIKYDKNTKEESMVPLLLYKEDVMCLYKDRNGAFVITKQGIMHKVPYKIEDLKEHLEM